MKQPIFPHAYITLCGASVAKPGLVIKQGLANNWGRMHHHFDPRQAQEAKLVNLFWKQCCLWGHKDPILYYFFYNCQGFHTEPTPPIPPSKSIRLLHKIIFLSLWVNNESKLLQITAILCLQVPWRYDYNKWWNMSVHCRVFCPYFVLTEYCL